MVNEKIPGLDYLRYETVEEFLEANRLSLDEGLVIMKREIERIEEKNLKFEKQ